MATYNWSSETCTAEGGNIFLKISHASEIVSRDGSAVVFNWGLRFRSLPYAKDGPATWTYNSIAMRVNITNEGVRNYYALYSPDCSIHNETEEFLYASYQNTSGTPTKYKTERLAIRQTAHADGPEAGYFTISVGTAWDRGVPNADRYTYTFTVPYPAATSYTITYNANGGTGGPSTQTKYQGYSTNLTNSKPTRSGYKFTGWNTRSDGSGTPWSPGEYYSGDSGMTLYAQWETTTPIFTPPTLNKTETTISWSNFSINTSSYVYYKLDEDSSWTYLGYGTYGFSGSITGLEASSYHTVHFRAENATDRSQATVNNASTTTYSYPYITGLSSSTIEAGSTQTVSIYNPLNRTVTLKIYKIEDYDNENTIYEYGTFGSTTTSSTSGSFTVPIDSIATVVKQNWRAWALYALEYNGTRQSTRWGVVTLPASINPVIDTNILWNYFFRYEDCAVENINGADRLVSSFTGSSTRLLRSRSKFCYHLDSDYSPFTTFYGASANTYYVTLNNSSMTGVHADTYYYQDSEGASTTDPNSASVVPDSSYYEVTFMVVDSRGKSATATYSINTYSLQAPTPTITSIARDDGYGTKATLRLSGTWCPNMYGSQVGKSLRFDYRAVGETSWTNYYLYNNSSGDAGYRNLAGTYSLDDITFDSGTAYEVRILAYNGFGWGKYSTIETLSLGTPLLFLDEYQHGLGVNCFPDGKGLSVDGFGHFTGNLTTNKISASGNVVSSGYLETLSNLYVGGNAYITGSIYRNGYLTLDTENIGSYALSLNGGLMKGPIELKQTGSHSNLILRKVDDYSGAGIGIDYQNREAVAIWTSRNNTAFRWHAGIDMTNMTDGMMLGITPDFEVTKNLDGTKPQIYKGGKPVPAVYIQSSTPDSTNLQVGDIWFII